MTAMIVRLVVPPAEEGSGPPQFLDYVIPPTSTREIPAPEGPPAQAVLYDESCNFLFVTFFGGQAGAGFDAGGQLFRGADLTAGFTAQPLAGQFPVAEADPRCAGVPFEPADY